MLEDVPAEAGRVFDAMLDMADTLPDTWQSAQFCLRSAHTLAQFVASHGGEVDPFSAADIMVSGSLLTQLAWFFSDASSVFSEGPVLDKLGKRLVCEGQAYIAVDSFTREQPNGTIATFLWWETTCAVCQEPFRFAVPAASNKFNPERCCVRHSRHVKGLGK
jgi:hypothetical protein